MAGLGRPRLRTGRPRVGAQFGRHMGEPPGDAKQAVQHALAPPGIGVDETRLPPSSWPAAACSPSWQKRIRPYGVSLLRPT